MRAAVVASANTRLAFGHLTRMATSGCAIEVDPCLVLLKGFALGRVASAGASHRGVSAGDREQREQRERTAVFMVFLFEGTVVRHTCRSLSASDVYRRDGNSTKICSTFLR